MHRLSPRLLEGRDHSDHGYDKHKRTLDDVLLPDGMNPQPGVGQARQVLVVSEVCAWGDSAGRTREGGTRLVG